jgi:hypothetical protein
MMNNPDAMAPLKVIFLDIDGPMKPARAYWLKPHRPDGNFDPLAVAGINLIHERTGAALVFNTTWNGAGYVRLCEIAANEGITAPVIGVTCFPGLGDRLDAIKLWIMENGPVEAWCALDDETMADDRCIRTSYDSGISVRDYSNAVRLLGRLEDIPPVMRSEPGPRSHLARIIHERAQDCWRA